MTEKNKKCDLRLGHEKRQGVSDSGAAYDLTSETNYNEEMKKYTIRGKLFAIIGKNLNNRLAVFKW